MTQRILRYGPFSYECSLYPADRFSKAAYAAQLLQIAAMAFAKLSSAFLVERVAPQSRKQRGFLFGMVGVWIVYSLFAFAFQCGLPNPWRFDPTKCAHGGPLFTIIILNMVSDVVLAGWIYPILRPLSMDRARRINVALLFGSRAIVPLAAGAQIWAATKLFQGNDPTWDAYYFTLLSQTVTSLSLIVASLPRIKRFLGAAGGGVNRPVIHDTEIALSTRRGSVSGSRAGNELKLIPSNSTKFTTTVISGRSKKKEKGKAQQEWQKFVSMGSKQDEHTSTSSLFDRHEDVICSNGVVRQQEVTVKIEDSDNPD